MLMDKMRTLLALTEKRFALDAKIKKLRTEIGAYEQEKCKFEEQFARLQKELRDGQKTVALLELDIKVLVGKEADLKRKESGLVRPRDVDAVRREILAIQDNCERVEDNLLEEIDRIEGLKKKIAQEEPAFLTKNAEFEEKIKIVQSYIAGINVELAPLLKEVEEVVSVLPENIKNQYKRAAVKYERPIVPLATSSCAACYGFISAQQVSELKKQRLGDCKNCGRIIFVDSMSRVDAGVDDVEC